MGTGVVGFNANFDVSIMGDINPHLIEFYSSLGSDRITPDSVNDYLSREGILLSQASDAGYDHYRAVRSRFNAAPNPLDFLFLNRAGFNGMIRFSKKGGWNIPFCKKPDRFIGMLKTKIVNQVSRVRNVITPKWEFSNSDFRDIIGKARPDDIIYCDPPYHGRHSDYFSSWSEKDEAELAVLLKDSPAKFILSTWHHNDFRENESLSKYWSGFEVTTREHFYHAGAKETNRRPMVEALVMNFTPKVSRAEDFEIEDDDSAEGMNASSEAQIPLGI
jgi:DNA adenine methylase